MKFARLTFLVAGIYGLIALLPLYFMEHRFVQQSPPPFTHPEFYYGFIGVAVSWQIAFLTIACDPRRYRAFIPAACIEKFSFVGACAVLFLQGRIGSYLTLAASLDLVFGILFVLSYLRLRELVRR